MDINYLKSRIMSEVSIVSVVEKYTKIKKTGNQYIGLCPFHNEKTPSFFVNPEKNLFNCFGCHMGGDLYKFVMEMEKLSFMDTVIKISQDYGIMENNNQNQSKYNEYYSALKLISDSYYNELKKNKIAINFLKQRKIKPEIVKELKISYAPSAINYSTQVLKQNTDLMNKVGIVKITDNEMKDRFNNRIMFPIFSSNNIVGFSGRAVSDSLPKYLNSPDTDIYKKSEVLYGLNFAKRYIKEKGCVIIVEGNFDFVKLYQNGIKNVVALLCTNFTDYQINLLKKITNNFILCLDNDNAGRNSTKKIIYNIYEKYDEIKINIVSLKDTKDPDSFIDEYGCEKFLVEIKNSTMGINYLIYNSKFKVELQNIIKSIYKKYTSNLKTEKDEKKIKQKTCFLKKKIVQLIKVTEEIMGETK